MYCTSFFLFLRRRKTTFLWRNAILKVPSWLQAHNLNEMELLICQLCVHVRHPLAKWICTNQGNTLHNLGVLHIVQCTRMRTRSCYFWLLCLRGMSKHAKGPFQVVKQSLNLEKRKPPLQQRRAKATCSEDKSSLSVCHPSCNPHKCLFDCPNAVMSTNSILWIVGWKAICWKGRAKCCAFLRVNHTNIPLTSLNSQGMFEKHSDLNPCCFRNIIYIRPWDPLLCFKLQIEKS